MEPVLLGGIYWFLGERRAFDCLRISPACRQSIVRPGKLRGYVDISTSSLLKLQCTVVIHPDVTTLIPRTNELSSILTADCRAHVESAATLRKRVVNVERGR